MVCNFREEWDGLALIERNGVKYINEPHHSGDNSRVECELPNFAIPIPNNLYRYARYKHRLCKRWQVFRYNENKLWSRYFR